MRVAVRCLLTETAQLLTSPRWALGVAVCLLVARLGAGDVAAQAENSGLSATAFDVHAAVANSLAYVGYLVLTTLAFIAGDTVAADLESHHVRLVLTRRVSIATWWLVKSSSVVIAAMAMASLLLGSCVLVGAWQGLPLTTTPSELAVAPVAARGSGLFPQVSATGNMWLRQLGVSVHLALSLSALLLAAVALTTRWPSRVLPVAVLLVGLMADYVAVKAWEPWRSVSPGLRLLEGVHRPTAAEPLSPAVSVLLFVGLIIAAVLLGLVTLGRRDL